MDHYTLEEKKIYVGRDDEYYEPRIGHLTDLNKAKEAFEVAISTAHLFRFDQVTLYKGKEPKESEIIARWNVPMGNWCIPTYPKKIIYFFRDFGKSFFLQTDRDMILFLKKELHAEVDRTLGLERKVNKLTRENEILRNTVENLKS